MGECVGGDGKVSSGTSEPYRGAGGRCVSSDGIEGAFSGGLSSSSSAVKRSLVARVAAGRRCIVPGDGSGDGVGDHPAMPSRLARVSFSHRSLCVSEPTDVRDVACSRPIDETEDSFSVATETATRSISRMSSSPLRMRSRCVCVKCELVSFRVSVSRGCPTPDFVPSVASHSVRPFPGCGWTPPSPCARSVSAFLCAILCLTSEDASWKHSWHRWHLNRARSSTRTTPAAVIPSPPRGRPKD